jgi:chromosome segregation ATPase
MKPALILLISGVLAASSAFAQKDRVYYRYQNDEGIMVLNSSIPPQFIHKGYEVVSIQGEVLKVVPPAPDEDEAEKMAQERRARIEQERYDYLLRRRYASMHDLEVDRDRSLLELENSINILENSQLNLRAQIEKLQAQAAAVERSGREVSPEILRHIAILQSEQQDTQLQIQHRRDELEQATERFERDYVRLQTLLKPRNLPPEPLIQQ